jgi:glutathione-regulated potassium-efflux system ancillary protein KefC
MSQHSLLFDAIVYLAAAVVCVPIASRLKLGSVLGYLAAGCVIGPFGLRIIQDPEETLHFAEFGVVLMLFVIGLELDPKQLWTLRRAVFGGGTLQLLAAALPLGAAELLFGLPWQAALVSGLALALSSTAVSMQTMTEKNLLHAPVGRSAFAVLLFQDIAAIPLLAIVPLLGRPESASTGTSSFWPVLRVLGAVVAVIVIGRFVTPRILRVVAKTGQREVFSAFTLLLVLGIAGLMAQVGISMALGAFLAGVLLAGSEYRHALETDIEPFRGLLMGLFFIAVGMSIDFALLASEPGFVLLLILGFQAIKALTLALVARPLGVSSRQSWLFAALLSQGGEFAFVVFGVARSARLLPGRWDALLTLAVALSMALTPFALILHDWVQARLEGKAPRREQDTIEDEHAQVIIAGFGRFGQIVGRLLFASGVRATVLDYDPDQVDLLRQFGFRVYYGDATRLDLLQAAGAERAELLVVAVDGPDASLRLVEAVREHFPKLRIVARARNVQHWQRLRSAGVAIVERETFESALSLGRRALELLGVRAFEAKERSDAFRRHNLASLEQVLPVWEDEAQRTHLARSARDQLEQQMERDRADLDRRPGTGWHSNADAEEEGGDERSPAALK